MTELDPTGIAKQAFGLITKEKWMREAKRYAKHAYCYENMVDEFPEYFAEDFKRGLNPYDTVDQFGEDNNLDRADGFYGINSSVKFVKDQVL